MAKGKNTVTNAADGRQGLVHRGPPTAHQDGQHSWKVGSICINSDDRSVWVCMDASPAAAVWIELETKRALGLFNQVPAGELIDVSKL
jgi:hypothetical protein